MSNRLGKVVREQGRKINWLARTLGISRARVYRIVSGEVEPTASERVRIAALLGVESDRLWMEDAHERDTIPAAKADHTARVDGH
jgi:plasmid maintenance system antidote protein VapI